ncbi:hypothetical protein ACFQ0M_05750 [Kitasatospora aburaviensis]
MAVVAAVAGTGVVAALAGAGFGVYTGAAGDRDDRAAVAFEPQIAAEAGDHDGIQVPGAGGGDPAVAGDRAAPGRNRPGARGHRRPRVPGRHRLRLADRDRDRLDEALRHAFGDRPDGVRLGPGEHHPEGLGDQHDGGTHHPGRSAGRQLGRRQRRWRGVG